MSTPLLRPARAAGPTTSAGLGLPPHLLARGRKRLRGLALGISIFVALDLLGSAAGWAMGFGHRFGVAVIMPIQVVLLGLSVGLWWLARDERLRHETVLSLGLAYQVALCFGVASAMNHFVLQWSGHLPVMTWTAIIIVLFPLVVPCPPRRTVIAALVASFADPIAIVLIDLEGLAAATWVDYVIGWMSPITAAIVALLCARVVYGLNTDVAKAQRLGSYRLEARIGQGGMGEVWRAQHELLARPAAVKLVRADSLAGLDTVSAERLQRRFEREARVTASLRSPHTVDLYDFGITDGGSFYYVMEILDGFDLDRLVAQHGPQPVARIVGILQQACDSLDEAHENGLVHRDIKPANIFVCRRGLSGDFVKILDFGLVSLQVGRSASVEGTSLTAQGQITGTPAYMPPEIALGEGPVDARADIYALGCVAHWLLTGMTVFETTSPMSAIVAHIKEPARPPSESSELPIPQALDAVVLACLAKKPADRPQSARALSERLAKIDLPSSWTPDDAAHWWRCHPPKPAPPPSIATETTHPATASLSPGAR